MGQPSNEPPRRQVFTGVWRSHYRYHSSSRQAEFDGEHLMQLHQADKYLIAESLPGSRSYVLIRLTVQDNVATGSWHEKTDPDGYYKGTTYHGAIQLLISDDGKRMEGKWVGFGKNMEVNVGPWELTYVGEDPPEDRLAM